MTAARAPGARSGPGLALAVLSAATFGTSGTLASSLIESGWSPAAAVTVRIAVSAVVLTVPAVLQLRGRWSVLRRSAAAAAAYGLIAVAGCQFFYFSAIQHMPVGVALLLEYMGVVLVVGWLWLRRGQRPRRLTVAGATMAVAGLALVLNLAGPARISPVGLFWGLLAAVGLACYFLLSAGTGSEQLPPVVMAWAGMCTGATVLGALGWTGVLPMTATTRPVSFLHHQVSWIVPVLGLSLLAAVVAYVAGIAAARRLGAKLASFAGLAEVLFAVLFAWLLLGQLPARIQFLGGVLILTGVALVRIDELHGSGQDGRLPGRRAGRRPGQVHPDVPAPVAELGVGAGPQRPVQAS